MIPQTLTADLTRLGITTEGLHSSLRTRKLSDARAMVAALLMESPEVRQVDIARFMGCTQAAVSKMLTRHKNLVAYHAPYRTQYQKLKNAATTL